MTQQGAEHIIEVLQEIRKRLIQSSPDPMLMERLQECIVLCREEVVRKKEKSSESV